MYRGQCSVDLARLVKGAPGGVSRWSRPRRAYIDEPLRPCCLTAASRRFEWSPRIQEAPGNSSRSRRPMKMTDTPSVALRILRGEEDCDQHLERSAPNSLRRTQRCEAVAPIREASDTPKSPAQSTYNSRNPMNPFAPVTSISPRPG